ncbi:DUF4124 domain-containing protein [Alteromonas aestuariivivens]|uniref:DUF4124 domain-containing protein n=1 Tax=Alteromonas aestuariivivens TaxID=1938339 RepID=A0A3D8MDN4_9ALTE|nr:DUF4124 domain-containing protein [Alteromonas aestuariivivens]RDV28959.1 DUF4124 domain-containing protein [Alteromonas aestuariivivens]
MTRLNHACALLILTATFASAGPLYKIVKDDGSVVYTDQPGPNAEEVILSSSTANTAQGMATPPPPPIESRRFNQLPPQQYQVRIVSPQPEATIRNTQGMLTIEAQSELGNDAIYELWFDGSAVSSNSSGVFQLQGINRGAHQFLVKLLDNTGKTLASSSEQTLYYHKPSVLINRN